MCGFDPLSPLKAIRLLNCPSLLICSVKPLNPLIIETRGGIQRRDGRQKTGERRMEAIDRRWETGDGRQEKGDR